MHRSKHQAVMALLLLWLPLSSVVAGEFPATNSAETPRARRSTRRVRR